MLFKDLQVEIEQPIIIHCNNAKSIKIATNLGVNPRTRYIIAHYHLERQKQPQIYTNFGASTSHFHKTA